MQKWPGAFPHTEFHGIPEGPAGTQATLQRMAKLVREYRQHPTLRQLAVELTTQLSNRDYVGELFALRQFVAQYIRYVPDIRETETLHTPLRTIQNRGGDCDDQAILVATLAETLNKPTRFVAYAFGDSGVFSHVLAQAKVGDSWVSLETTVPVPLGWSPPDAVNKMVAYV